MRRIIRYVLFILFLFVFYSSAQELDNTRAKQDSFFRFLSESVAKSRGYLIRQQTTSDWWDTPIVQNEIKQGFFTCALAKTKADFKFPLSKELLNELKEKYDNAEQGRWPRAFVKKANHSKRKRNFSKSWYSKPIFLNASNLALVEQQGESGSSLVIYELVDGHWINRCLISLWVS